MDTPEELPTVLSLCSGYGGIERGFSLAGFKHRAIAFVEIEAYAIARLANKMERGKLLPAPIYTNLKTLPVQPFRDRVDILTGGYPCQPFSAAGKRLGEDDPRHLWPHIREIVRAIRPVRCFFENVEGHISLGLREVISDLESLGYKVAFGIFSAREVGAPHQRKRVYILADSNGVRCDRRELSDRTGERPVEVEALQRPQQPLVRSKVEGCGGDSGENDLADSICSRSETGISGSERPKQEGNAGITDNCDSEPGRWQIGMHGPVEPRLGRGFDGSASWVDGTWEMGVERVTAGCPDRVDRIRLLGNGVVPQTAAKAWVTLQEQIKH